MTRKLYTGPLVDVSFDLDVCIHAGECLRGMPEVFNVTKRPWIELSGVDTPAKADKLRTVIGRCPSFALKVEEHTARSTGAPHTAGHRVPTERDANAEDHKV